MNRLKIGKRVNFSYIPKGSFNLLTVEIELYPFEYFSIIQNFNSLTDPCIYCENHIYATGLNEYLSQDDYKKVHYSFYKLNGQKICIKFVEDLQFYV